MQLHVTRSLFAKLPLDEPGGFAVTPHSQYLFDQPSLQINPLSGWHGKLLKLQRRNCLVFVHDVTRFPLFMPCLTQPDFVALNDRFVDALINTLLKCGADQNQLEMAHHCLRPLQLDTQCNRSVQGTLNRMGQDVEHAVNYDSLTVADMTGYSMGAWLADRPCTVKDRGMLWPKKEMLNLLSRLAIRHNEGELG